PPRSALMVECFEPMATPEQLFARLEVIGRHATPALYNAVEHRRIPMRFIWQPLAKVQEGLGGKAKAIGTLILVGVMILLALLIFMPYPLKLDANGNLLPEQRRWVFSEMPSKVELFRVKPNAQVEPGSDLVLLYDHDLEVKLVQLEGAI